MSIETFLGTWKFVSQSNTIEETLAAQAMRLTPTIVYTLESATEIKVEFQTIVKNMSQVYAINGETQHRDYDGELVTTTTQVDYEGKLIMTCRGKKIGPLRTVREFMENGHLKITTEVVDKNVSCFRIFRQED